MSKRKHVHKYQRVIISGNKTWSCALPDCSHYMPLHMETILPGKLSRCWNCDEQFLLDANNMLSDRPVCANCDVVVDAIDSAIKNAISAVSGNEK